LVDKQLEQYPTANNTEINEEAIKEFRKELESFFEKKLGGRIYACSYSFENETAGQKFLHSEVIGSKDTFPFLRTISCMKGAYQVLLTIFQQINVPLPAMTSDSFVKAEPTDAKSKKKT